MEPFVYHVVGYFFTGLWFDKKDRDNRLRVACLDNLIIYSLIRLVSQFIERTHFLMSFELCALAIINRAGCSKWRNGRLLLGLAISSSGIAVEPT